MATAATMARTIGSAGRDLGRPQIGSNLVEHTVDEAMAVGGAELFRELDGLVDHHAIRDVEARAELPGTDDEDRALDRRDVRRLAGKVRLDRRHQRFVVAGHALPELLATRNGCA